MKVLVSACLLGRNCKYNGGNNFSPEVAEFLKDKEIVEMCPEIMAGLGTPRPPIEIVNGILTDIHGKDVDRVLRTAAEQAAEVAGSLGVDCAVLQSRSPTCGVNQVYDGSFSGKLIPGQGVFARALSDMGCRVFDAEDVRSGKIREYFGNTGL